MSDDEGFLSRWSRRKTQRRAGVALPEESLGDPLGAPVRDLPSDSARAPAADPKLPPIDTPLPAAPPTAVTAAPAEPAPTLADVARLTPTSDFSRFVAAGVDPSVQHAALKTLFSDPHFNVMDGLDVYIDDYNTPNPIPETTRRRLLAIAAQRLEDAMGASFEPPATPAEPEPAAGVIASPDGAAQLPEPTIASCDPATAQPRSDEDLALRLQPDDAADTAGAGADRPGARA